MTYFPQTTTISYAHEKCHSGKFFNFSYVGNGILAAANLEVLIQTGSPAELHAAFGFDVEGQCEMLIYEGTTVSAAGTAVTIIDVNRVTANTSQATATHTPTVTAVGTQLRHVFVPGGTIFPPGGSDGAPVRGGTELILAPSTNYLIRVNNTSGGTIDIGVEVGFYEE